MVAHLSDWERNEIDALVQPILAKQRKAINCKAKGNRQEHRTMALLEAAGYACTRAAASLGVFDVIGIGTHDVVLVQCKSNRWPGSVEMEAIRLFQCGSFCRKLVHVWDDGKRLPRVKEVP